MLRLIRRLAVATGLLAMVAGATAALLYRAATAPIPEYAALLAETESQRDSGMLDESRQELESQIASLVSDVQKNLPWRTVVTAQQINGWLATQLVEDFPQLEEQGLANPRVMLRPGVATLALQTEVGGFPAVVAVDLSAFVTPQGELALELLAARVGAAPLPVRRVVASLNQATQGKRLPGRWSQNEGRPVWLLNLDDFFPSADQSRRLDSVEVRDSELYLAGATVPATARVAALPARLE